VTRVIGHSRDLKQIERLGFEAGPWDPKNHGYEMLSGPPAKRGRPRQLDEDTRSIIRAQYQRWLHLRAALEAVSPSALAKQYGVSESHIEEIGSSAGPVAKFEPPPKELNHRGKPRFSDDQVLRIREEYDSGTGQKQLAKKWNVNRKVIQDIVHGRTYRQVGGELSKPLRICPTCRQVIGVALNSPRVGRALEEMIELDAVSDPRSDEDNEL